MTMTERLLEVGNMLPQSALAELLDFAEFLRQKTAHQQTLQGRSLAELGGGLEKSITFADSSLAIQEKIRHEWN